MRKAARNALFDRLHKGVVITCVAVTLYGTLLLGLRAHRYFTVIRPESKERELLQKQELLKEGAAPSSQLFDKATELKM